MPKAPKPINDTTFEVELLGGDKVEIGDKGSTDFKPHIKLNRWDGECFIKVELPTTEKPKPVVEGGKVKFKGKDFEAHFYPLEPKTVIAKDKDGNDVPFTQNELGGFEFEIILKKKPVTNKIVLNIETQGLKFYYQPELTEEEKKTGFRPDNVVGSYAVYHATRTNTHRSKEDAEKYKAGKAFHIYRPKVTDANGDWVWAELNIDEQAGTLTITIDQDWLDGAVYPVGIDPTFGYETIGSTDEYSANLMQGSWFTCPEAGTGDSITVYNDWASSLYVQKAAIYKKSDNSLVGTTVTIPAPKGWVTFDFDDSPSLSNIDYWLLIWQRYSDPEFRYDSGDAGKGHRTTGYTWGTWPDPITITEYARIYSIYCTYTAGGPAKVTQYLPGNDCPKFPHEMDFMANKLPCPLPHD